MRRVTGGSLRTFDVVACRAIPEGAAGTFRQLLGYVDRASGHAWVLTVNGVPAIEAQAFSVRSPGAFFNIYSSPRSETSFKPWRDRLNEELRFMSRMVCPITTTRGSLLLNVLALVTDLQCVYYAKREPLHPILHALPPPTSRPAQAAHEHTTSATGRRERAVANEPGAGAGRAGVRERGR